MDSILTSIKKLLGIDERYTHFDSDIIMHINSVFFVLNQLGVGPAEGFSIKDNQARWEEYLPEKQKLEIVKSYIHMKVKLMFDPPVSSSVQNAMTNMINECEWRLLVAVDPTQTNGEEENQNG